VSPPPPHEGAASTGRERLALWSACCAVLLLGSLPFLGVRHNAFVLFDDPGYVFENPWVGAGLSFERVVEAFALEQRMSNWHPLTWVSHMLDVSLFGLDPAGHHLMSVALHAANALLLLLALRALTGDLWRPALVAALFAAHPLRVESVAWAAERKDVLSGLFWMLCLLTYAAWTRRRDGRPPWALIACFTAGLLSKPMVITLPCVLLLLDLWPLRRAAAGGATPGGATPGGAARGGAAPDAAPAAAAWRPLLVEKLPLLLLSALSAVVTVVVQRQGAAVKTLDLFPLGTRLLNVPLATMAYVRDSFWPSGLTFLYPHPGRASVGMAWQAAAATGLLLLVSACAWWLRRRQPWWLVGWAWFLVMLLPVIGLVQVGEQSHADRYTYLPTIGLAIMLAYGLGALVRRWPAARLPVVGGCLLAVGGLAALTPAQVASWRDSRTLYERALGVTERNYAVHSLLGALEMREGHDAAARVQLETALAIQPQLADAHYNLGVVCMQGGEDERAAEAFRQTLRLWPQFSDAHNNLGIVLARQGRYEAAIEHLEQALRFGADNEQAAGNLRTVRRLQAEAARR